MTAKTLHPLHPHLSALGPVVGSSALQWLQRFRHASHPYYPAVAVVAAAYSFHPIFTQKTTIQCRPSLRCPLIPLPEVELRRQSLIQSADLLAVRRRRQQSAKRRRAISKRININTTPSQHTAEEASITAFIVDDYSNLSSDDRRAVEAYLHHIVLQRIHC